MLDTDQQEDGRPALWVRARRWIALMGVAPLVAVAVVGCGGSGSEGGSDPGDASDSGALTIDGEEIAAAALMDRARSEGQVTVYSGFTEETELAIAEKFEKDTGIEVKFTGQLSPELAERALSERAAGELKADVISVSGASVITQLEEEGLLKPHKVPAWDALNEQFKAADGAYYWRILGPVITAYNAQEVEEGAAPKRWVDLLDPRWRGRLGLPDPSVNGTSLVSIILLREKLGPEFVERLAAQDPKLADGSATIADSIARGELALGTNPISVAASIKEEGAPIELVFPEEGVPISPFYIGQVADSPNPSAAEVYLNWSMSTAGARAVVSESDLYSVRDEVGPPEVDGQRMPTLEQMGAWYLDPAEEQRVRDSVVKEFEQAVKTAGG